MGTPFFTDSTIFSVRSNEYAFMLLPYPAQRHCNPLSENTRRERYAPTVALVTVVGLISWMGYFGCLAERLPVVWPEGEAQPLRRKRLAASVRLLTPKSL